MSDPTNTELDAVEVRRLARLRSLGRYVSGIVHDLNNSLGGIVAYVDEQRYGDAKGSGPASASPEDIARLDEALERSMGLLRTVARYAMKPGSRTQKIQLSALLADLQNLVRSSWRRRGIELAVDLQEDATVRALMPESVAFLLQIAELVAESKTVDQPLDLVATIATCEQEGRSWGVIEFSTDGDPGVDVEFAKFVDGGGLGVPASQPDPSTDSASFDSGLADAVIEQVMSGAAVRVAREGQRRRLALLLPLARGA